MHGKSIAWVRDRCRLEGAYRPLLYAVATHAGNHYADCTASAKTLSRASGLSHRHVQRLLPELVDMGVLEQLDAGSGRRPACYRLAPPLWVEGDMSATDVVEAAATAADVVEGTSGDPTSPQWVIHSTASYDTRSQQSTLPVGAEPRSYDIGDPVATTSSIRSYDTIYGLSSQDASQDKNLEEKNVEDKNVPRSRSLAQSARSNAGRAAPDAVFNPPEVDEDYKAWLRSRGLGAKHQPRIVRAAPPVDATPTLDQETQLAELRHRYAAEFQAQERQEHEAHAGVAQGNGAAPGTAVAIAANA